MALIAGEDHAIKSWEGKLEPGETINLIVKDRDGNDYVVEGIRLDSALARRGLIFGGWWQGVRVIVTKIQPGEDLKFFCPSEIPLDYHQ